MEYNSIYGAIKIDRDYAGSIAFIKSIGEDNIYPFINTNMFGLGEFIPPYYYENMVITFGTTYKGFGLELQDWNLLILKIENILRNIDFECAQFHIDSYVGDYIFFWANKQKLDDRSQAEHRAEVYRLIETEEFFFGFGDRGLNIAYPDPRYHKNYDELDFAGFSYPVKFSDESYKNVQVLTDKINKFAIGSTINVWDINNGPLDERSFEIIYSLMLKGFIKITNRYPLEIILYKNIDV